MNMANVKTHMPVVLDLGKSNYGKWRMLVTVLLGKYELSNHVLVETPEDNPTTEWNREDFIVRSWLYGSISEEILDIIMAENQTAHDVYMLIRNLFLDNQMTLAIHLEAEFRALIQGNLSITAYCHHLKSLSDALRDVGQPISDHTLVLTCLRSLNLRFSDITSLVTMQRPLPLFLQTRSLLLLRETQLHHTAPTNQQTVLYGLQHRQRRLWLRPTLGLRPVLWQQQQHQRCRYRGKKKNTGYTNNSGGGHPGGGGYHAPHPRSAPVGPWVSFNPATGVTQQMPSPAWRPAGGPSILGPCPSTPRSPSYGPA
jgi:hypothetical protein